MIYGIDNDQFEFLDLFCEIEEFIAHESNVNCIRIGRKNSGILVTGGDDHLINLWSIGKPNAIMKLLGHSSAVESVTFDPDEVTVIAGAANGTIKLWDIEEGKAVRSFLGHRSNCISVDFHPFGELFASGSLDTNLKLWDMRRKGCIRTYKGHSQGINEVKFSPDGRWLVSGGADNVVKLWDLTAGKLLHDFKSHEGPIQCANFHPCEVLLATGSADKTVKFWDLDTFELIGSSRPESSGICHIIFSDDGRTLFSGIHESLKVLSWEPIRYHDTIDMGWSGLSDLTISNDKLLGCSYHQNCVGVWVVDISQIKPYSINNVVTSNLNEMVAVPRKLPSYAVETKSTCTQESSKNIARLKTSNILVQAGLPVTGLVELKNDDDSVTVSEANGLQRTSTKQSVVLSSEVSQLSAVVERCTLSTDNDATGLELFTERNVESVKLKCLQYPAINSLMDGNMNCSSRKGGMTSMLPRFQRTRCSLSYDDLALNNISRTVSAANIAGTLDERPSSARGENRPDSSEDIVTDLLEQHKQFLSSAKYRLKKLKHVHRLWQKKDIKGVIDAIAKMSDYAVSANVISILLQRSEFITLEICTYLLPLLTSLLRSSKTRHLEISLEMLLKIVKTFGLAIGSAISAYRPVGLDLQADQRMEHCNLCFIELRNIKGTLPSLKRKEGSVRKSAIELNLFLQDMLRITY